MNELPRTLRRRIDGRPASIGVVGLGYVGLPLAVAGILFLLFFSPILLPLRRGALREFEEEYKEYIYGSADVVGLMCLCVFVKGDQVRYEELKDSAMALGSAFQKVNFLRDLRADFDGLERTYFPNTNLLELDEASKDRIVAEIEADFAKRLNLLEAYINEVDRRTPIVAEE